MKKFLSLVLALVMTMSLVTISAGAKDFTDGDKVNYAEAIDVMSAVKVVDGYTDGSFKPQAQLNRGQAAKILCNMILSPTTASALKADSAPFKDVAADSTFAGYIAYCAQAGIIDGYTDGTFRPAAPLTGYAFMKLLLGALGYDKDIEGYNVPNWSINVAKQALAIGLDDGLTGEFDGTKIVTREEACLFALNTMKADMVNYDNRTTVNVGGTEIVVGGSKPEVITSNPGNKMNKANLQFAEKYFTNLTRQDVKDAFGRPSNKWTLKTSSIGTYVKSGDLVATYTKGVKESALYELIGSSLVDDLNAGRADLHVYMNGAYPTNDGASQLTGVKYRTTTGTGSMFRKNNSDKIGDTGVKTEIYVDDSGSRAQVTVVGTGTYLVKAAEDFDTRKETVRVDYAGDTGDFITLHSLTLSQDDFDVKDVKADDYLLITVAYNGTDFDVKSVTPAEVKTGTVNSYSFQDSVTMDGEELDYSYATSKGANKVKDTNFVVGQTASVVLDTYGNIIGIDSSYVAGNYVYIYEAQNVTGLHGGNITAAAYFTDGTNADVVVKKIYGNTATAINHGTQDGWYTFSKNSKNEYNLMKVEGKYGAYNVANQKASVAGSGAVIVNGKVSFLGGTATGATAVKGDSKTLFVVLEADGTVSTYTGIKNVPDITLTAGTANITYLKDNTGYADFVFVELPATVTITGKSTSDFVYVIKQKNTTYIDDNHVYYTYTVLDADGNETTIKSSDPDLCNTGNDGNGVYRLFYKARKNADGEVTQLTKADASALDLKIVGTSLAGQTVTYSNDTLDLGVAEYTLADDAKIVLVTLKATGLNKDADAKYEAAANISGKTLAAVLKNFTIGSGEFYGELTEAGGNELSTLYVTVRTKQP